MDIIKDKLVERIEPVLKRYKESVLKDKHIDYRNFAAHDIAKIVITFSFELVKESPTGTFEFDSHAANVYKDIATHCTM